MDTSHLFSVLNQLGAFGAMSAASVTLPQLVPSTSDMQLVMPQPLQLAQAPATTLTLLPEPSPQHGVHLPPPPTTTLHFPGFPVSLETTTVSPLSLPPFHHQLHEPLIMCIPGTQRGDYNANTNSLLTQMQTPPTMLQRSEPGSSQMLSIYPPSHQPLQQSSMFIRASPSHEASTQPPLLPAKRRVLRAAKKPVGFDQLSESAVDENALTRIFDENLPDLDRLHQRSAGSRFFRPDESAGCIFAFPPPPNAVSPEGTDVSFGDRLRHIAVFLKPFSMQLFERVSLDEVLRKHHLAWPVALPPGLPHLLVRLVAACLEYKKKCSEARHLEDFFKTVERHHLPRGVWLQLSSRFGRMQDASELFGRIVRNADADWEESRSALERWLLGPRERADGDSNEEELIKQTLEGVFALELLMPSRRSLAFGQVKVEEKCGSTVVRWTPWPMSIAEPEMRRGVQKRRQEDMDTPQSGAASKQLPQQQHPFAKPRTPPPKKARLSLEDHREGPEQASSREKDGKYAAAALTRLHSSLIYELPADDPRLASVQVMHSAKRLLIQEVADVEGRRGCLRRQSLALARAAERASEKSRGLLMKAMQKCDKGAGQLADAADELRKRTNAVNRHLAAIESKTQALEEINESKDSIFQRVFSELCDADERYLREINNTSDDCAKTTSNQTMRIDKEPADTRFPLCPPNPLSNILVLDLVQAISKDERFRTLTNFRHRAITAASAMLIDTFGLRLYAAVEIKTETDSDKDNTEMEQPLLATADGQPLTTPMLGTAIQRLFNWSTRPDDHFRDLCYSTAEALLLQHSILHVILSTLKSLKDDYEEPKSPLSESQA